MPSLFAGLIVPDNTTYEWKRKTVKNWEWDDQERAYAANGWTPVPASRHNGAVMPKGYDGPIEIPGFVLMQKEIAPNGQIT